MGLWPSLRRRPAADFREHRKYVPGDDVRFVDWRASARHEQIFLKQGEQPRQSTIYVLLDVSGSMAWGEPPKSDAALALAAAFGYLALAHGDRLQVIPLHDQGPAAAKPLGSISGKGQLPALIQYLRGLTFEGQADVGQAVGDFSRKAARGGIVLLVSDLLAAEDFAAALAPLPPPAWKVAVLHILHPQELHPEIDGDLEMIDQETGEKANYDLDAKALAAYQDHLRAWRQALERTCIDHHALYTLIRSDWSLEQEVIPHLRQLGLLEPLSG